MKTMTVVLAAAAATFGLAAAGVAGPARAVAVSAPPGLMAWRSGDGPDADGAFDSIAQFSEPTGEKMYRRVCAGCHMPDAKGANQGAGFYPALAGDQNLAAPGYPLMVVLHGRHGMPAVGRMMSDDQVAAVVNYVRTNFGNKFADKVTAADAKAAR
jgi:mono/diheme cytochrome c family protein